MPIWCNFISEASSDARSPLFTVFHRALLTASNQTRMPSSQRFSFCSFLGERSEASSNKDASKKVRFFSSP